jgi:hypothetical protein
MRRIITFLFCSIFIMHAFAHKPVLNENSTYPADAPYEIEEVLLMVKTLSGLLGMKSMESSGIGTAQKLVKTSCLIEFTMQEHTT